MKLDILVALVLIATLAHAQAAKPQSEVNPASAGKVLAEQERTMSQRELIESYERKMLQADKAGDWGTISGHMTEDFLEIAGDGRYYSKQQIAKLFPEQHVNEYKIGDIQFRSLGPGTALLAYRLEVQATFQGKSLPAAFLISSIWMKRDGAWKVIFHQGTPIPAQAAKQ